MTDTWEQRMSARTKERAAAAQRERDAAERAGWERSTTPRPWMNGWPRLGRTSLLMGTQVRCVGCGRDCGTTSVVAVDNQPESGPEPAWPFGFDDCPVCDRPDSGAGWAP